MIEIEITPDLLCRMLTTGNEIHLKVIEGLPEGTTLGDVYWSPLADNGNIRLRFDHQGPHEKVRVTFRDLRCALGLPYPSPDEADQ